VRFTTYSLVYPQMEWVFLTGLEKQWERSDLNAEVKGPGEIAITTKNITSFILDPARALPELGDKTKDWSVTIDGQKLAGSGVPASGFQFAKEKGQWVDLHKTEDKPDTLAKTPVTCGPIDHAFMSSFVFVRPTGKQLNKAVGDWAEAELSHAVSQWRAVFRGNARVIADNAVSDADIASSNLVLWGDPSSNAILKKIVDKLPLKWDAKQLVFGGKTYDATHIAPVLIFPNPLNPEHYVVINSSFTFREFAALNNANQTPKLPDWAIVDLNTAPDALYPGKILRAGFFNEQWQPPTQ
jgi:hypothetical protein